MSESELGDESPLVYLADEIGLGKDGQIVFDVVV
jgi:hypothetical protein